VDDSTERQAIAETLYGLLVALLRRVPRDISLTAASTLATLERLGPQRLTDLAALQGITQPSMTALVANLTADGLVERHQGSKDRRVSFVAITASGSSYVRERRQRNADSFLQLIEQLTDGEYAALVAATPALERLRQIDVATQQQRR
jgi:DNA-binding MarR family transcriptional regulator